MNIKEFNRKECKLIKGELIAAVQFGLFGEDKFIEKTPVYPDLNVDYSKNIIVSFSGGRTSSFMAEMLLSYILVNNIDRRKIHFVFANTGKENKETLDFIDRCDKEWGPQVHWIEAFVIHEKNTGTVYKEVNFKTASRNGEPFYHVIKKYGLTNKHYPHCTRELKEVIIRKWAKDKFPDGDYQMAIGMRTDERKRVNFKKGVKEKWVYPLVFDFPTDKKMVKSFWDNYHFNLEIDDYEGNCDLCWKKSLKKRLTIIKDNPDKADWWERMEKEDGEYVFDRDGYSIIELRKMAKEMSKQEILKLEEPGFSCSCFS